MLNIKLQKSKTWVPYLHRFKFQELDIYPSISFAHFLNRYHENNVL